jgi:hypothetical protein
MNNAGALYERILGLVSIVMHPQLEGFAELFLVAGFVPLEDLLEALSHLFLHHKMIALPLEPWFSRFCTDRPLHGTVTLFLSLLAFLWIS